MAEHEDQFAPENVDEQLDSLPLVLWSEDARLLHDLRRGYQSYAQKNARSLEDVWYRIVASKGDALPEHTRPLAKEGVAPVRQSKRTFPMQDTISVSTQKGNTRTKIGTAITVGFLTVLVASMLFVFNLAHRANSTNTAHPGQSPATAPTHIIKNSSGLYIVVGKTFEDYELQKLDIKSHTLLWRYDIKGATGGYTISGDTVYLIGLGAGTDKVADVQALNANTGKLRWSVSLASEVQSAPSMSFVTLSGPTVNANNDTLYVSSEDGKVFALKTSNGKQLWKYDSGTPTWVDGTRYDTNPVTITGNVVYGTFHNLLFAVDARTGKQIWSATTKEEQLFSMPQTIGNSVYVSSSEISHHTVGQSEQGYVYAYNSNDGSLHWSFQAQNWVRSAPVISNGVVYFGSHDTNVYALRASSGKLLWKQSTPGQVFASPTVSNGVVYVSQSGNATATTESTVKPSLLALNATNGEILWQKQLDINIYDLQNGVIYASAFPRTMLGIDAHTGKVLWQEKHGADLVDKYGNHSGSAPIIEVVP